MAKQQEKLLLWKVSDCVLWEICDGVYYGEYKNELPNGVGSHISYDK